MLADKIKDWKSRLVTTSMSILGMGVDVVYVPRILALIHRRGSHKFASRILSPQELSDWNALPPSMVPFARARFLAVR